jgi:hypothetical protein
VEFEQLKEETVGLFSIRGQITAVGQSNIWHDGKVYQWIEIEDTTGQRINVSKVVVQNEVMSLACQGATGEFFFEKMNSRAKRMFGIKWNSGEVAFDAKNVRSRIGLLYILYGFPLLLLWGIGLLVMAYGLYLVFSPNDSERKMMFYGTDQQEAQRIHRQVPIRI